MVEPDPKSMESKVAQKLKNQRAQTRHGDQTCGKPGRGKNQLEGGVKAACSARRRHA